MKILMILSGFVPEIGSGAQINYDLARSYVKHGHTLDIITSYPRKYKLTNPYEDILEEEFRDGVHIHRVKHYYTRDSKILRGLEHFYTPLYYLRKYMQLTKESGKYDIVFTHIPPLPMYYLAKIIKMDKTPVILNIPDYHPQELVDVGFLRNKLIIAILSHIEKTACKNAYYITVQSPGGIEYVINRGAKKERVSYIYNSANKNDIDTTLRIKDTFKEDAGISGKILITYAGIFSSFQNIDVIVDTAKSLSNNTDVIFYLVGSGTEYKRISERILNEEINNIQIMPYLPREEYLRLINASDIALVSLDNRMHAPCIPGKMVNLLGLGKAVFAIIPDNCETQKMIEESKCGVCVSPGNVDEISQKLSEMITGGKLKEYGTNGRVFFEQNLTSEVASSKYEEIMRDLIEESLK